MALPEDRGRRFAGRPRATGLPPWRKVVVRTSAVATLLTGLVLLGYYGLYTVFVLDEALSNADTVHWRWLTLPSLGFPAVVGVGLLVSGLDQWFLRDDHKLSVVMLCVLSIPVVGGVGWSQGRRLNPTGAGGDLLIMAIALCLAATWILHRAHRATAAPPQPERIG